MANPDIGRIKCPCCKEDAPVRKESRGKRSLYVACGRCGMLTPRLPAGQAFILDNAEIWGEDKADEARQRTVIEPPPKPAPGPVLPAPARDVKPEPAEPAKPAKRPGLLEGGVFG